MNNIHICGEIGANHDRRIKQAFSMIDLCAEVGCNSAKFQTYSSEKMYSKYTPDFDKYKNIPELIKSIELPREWQKDLKQYCDNKNIEFISTPFDYKAVDELVELGIKRIKIASFEATDEIFVRYIGNTNLPIIFSTGLMNQSEIIKTISWLLEEHCPDITVLHCISSYPTLDNEIQLWRLKYLKNLINKEFNKINNIHIGFSDHTHGTLASSLSVMEGVIFIEKHITLSKRLSGPDHPFALEPLELKELVNNIRKSEVMYGQYGQDRPLCEKEMKKASRSVIAKRKLKVGETITIDDIVTKRPYLGQQYYHASEYREVLGKKVLTEIKEDEIILKEKVK